MGIFIVNEVVVDTMTKVSDGLLQKITSQTWHSIRGGLSCLSCHLILRFDLIAYHHSEEQPLSDFNEKDMCLICLRFGSCDRKSRGGGQRQLSETIVFAPRFWFTCYKNAT